MSVMKLSIIKPGRKTGQKTDNKKYLAYILYIMYNKACTLLYTIIQTV